MNCLDFVQELRTQLQTLQLEHESTSSLRTQLATARNQLAVLGPLVGRDEFASIETMVGVLRPYHKMHLRQVY